jgi:hypothetical protein
MLKTTNVLREFSIKMISSYSTLLPHEATTNCELYRTKYNIGNFRGPGLKKKFLKNSICSSLIFLTFYTPVFAAPPKYYSFKSDIYDQEEILKRRNYTSLTKKEKEELNEELMKELLRRKTEQLEKKFLNKILSKIEKLHEQLEEAGKGQFMKAIIKIFSHTPLHSLAHEIFKEPEPVAPTGAATGAAIGVVTGGLPGAVIGTVVGIVAEIGLKVTGEYVTHKLNENIDYKRGQDTIINRPPAKV